MVASLKKYMKGGKESMFKKILGIGSAVATSGLVFVGHALAEPSLTVPDVSTADLYDSGTAVLAAVAIFVGIGLAIRMFKRA